MNWLRSYRGGLVKVGHFSPANIQALQLVSCRSNAINRRLDSRSAARRMGLPGAPDPEKAPLPLDGAAVSGPNPMTPQTSCFAN